MISRSGESDHGSESCWTTRWPARETEPRGEYPVVGARRPAALEVAEDDAAGFVSGLILDQLGDDVADPAQADVAERVGLGVDVGRALFGELGAFRHDHDAVILACRPSAFEHIDDVGDVDGDFGDEDIVGRDGDAREAGNPAGVAAHRLDDHDRVCGFRWWFGVRSTASVTMLMAVSKPNVKSVTIRSLSMVLGTPTMGI